MKKPRLEAAASKLLQLGIIHGWWSSIAATRNSLLVVAAEILSAADAQRAVEYEVGDFIRWNDGMGELGFGIVTEPLDDQERYKVHSQDSGVRYVPASDVFGLSSLAEFDAYDIERR